MLMKFLAQTDSEVGDVSQKRTHERRNCDQCASELNGKTYPVINWSQGGVLIQADDRLFDAGEEYGMRMKFHIQNRILDINHPVEVVRKGGQRVAFRFKPLNDDIRRNFQQIIDDSMAREFTDSQA